MGIMIFTIIDSIYQSVPKTKYFLYPTATSDWQWKILSVNFSSIIFINYGSFVLLILFIFFMIIFSILGI